MANHTRLERFKGDLMFRFMMVMMIVFFSTSSYAQKKTVDIVTRFGPAAVVGRSAIELATQLNKIQDEYEFRATQVNGSGGEAADQLALQKARSGENVLAWQSTTNYTFNRYLVGNTYDRDNDFIPLQSMMGIPFSIFVDPSSKINTVDDLVKALKNKPQGFAAFSNGSSGTLLLTEVFLRKYDIKNIKFLGYKDPYETAKAVAINEADFTVFNHADTPNLKMILISSNERVKGFDSIPTGKEIGMSDFLYTSLSMISVPKERIGFGIKIKPYLKQVCEDKDYQEKAISQRYIPICRDTDFIKARIKDELNLVDKYKDNINFR